MKKSIYLDFTLPVFLQKDLIYRYTVFLKSLIKNLEKTSNIKFYISLNLSNEFHLNDTFFELTKLIKSLVEQDRAEIVISSAFNISNGSSEHLHVYDMLYSEYFSGYYIGLPRDFEGDSCIMVKNLHTAFFPEGNLNSHLINSVKLLSLERIFADKSIVNEALLYKGVKIIPLDMRLKGLFEGYITADTVIDFLNHSSDSMIYYLNIFEIFNNYFQNSETNISNLIYFLDKGNINWDLIDIDDENMKYNDNLPLSILNKMQDDLLRSDLDHSFKEDLIKKISHRTFVLDNIEDFRRSPIWKRVGQDEIDSQNMFNLRLMTLLSNEVSRKNILLNKDLSIHLNDIIDEIVVSDYCSEDLKSLILNFKDKINQK